MKCSDRKKQEKWLCKPNCPQCFGRGIVRVIINGKTEMDICPQLQTRRAKAEQKRRYVSNVMNRFRREHGQPIPVIERSRRKHITAAPEENTAP